jgi:glutathione S-transferase
LLAGEHKHPDFLRLNPAGKVPVLVDGDTIIPESAAIVLYLAEKYHEKGLLPASLALRAQDYRWTMFAVTELEQPLWRISKHTALYPEDKRLPADIALAREEFLATAAVLDTYLDGRRFIVGDEVTVADCVTAYVVDWANEFHLLDDFRQCAPISSGRMRALRRHSVSPKLLVKSVPRDGGLDPCGRRSS